MGRKAVGTNGQALVADSGQSDGLKWGYPGKSYSEVILADSPVGYWRLGESSGTSAADATGNGNTGTYTDSYTLAQTGDIAGDTDKAVAFSGANSTGGYVAVPDVSALRFTSALTFEAWIRLRAVPSDRHP